MLEFAQRREKDEEEFNNVINEAIEKVITAMRLKESEEQMYHCLGVIEYMRRKKAIALVGSVCSGKTTVLKIVS
jgi:ABC-type polysaccharide/polyol phosphate transport system ATPase subunit